VATAAISIGLGRRRSGDFGRLTRALTSTPFLGLALTILTWPINGIVPATGPDASWIVGLYLAHAEGLHFGPEFVWTYGPLGFLEVPVVVDGLLWTIAFLYQALIHVGVAVVLLWTARRAFPLPVAVAACYCLLGAGRLGAAATLIAFLWAFAVVTEDAPAWAPAGLAVGGGVLAAAELLGKANYGIDVLVLVLIGLMGAPGRMRNLAMFAPAFGLSLPLLWLAAGQDLGFLPTFVARQAEIVSGYSGAMGADILAADWALPAAAGVSAALLAAVVAFTGRASLGRRIAAFGLVAFFCFASFKQGFVRQGYGNTPEFFVLAGAVGVAVAGCAAGSRRALGQGVAVSLIGLALFAMPGSSLWHSLQAAAHLDALRESTRALSSPGYRKRLATEARASMRGTYRLDPRIVAALGRRPVQIDPWEIGIAWAYDLNWHPLPVAQTYSAYTPGLDEANAAVLEGETAPAAILRYQGGEPGLGSAIDGRYPGWESPAAMRAMLCHYRSAIATARFQLLERTGDRCGPIVEIGSAQTKTGSSVHVPAPPHPGDMVFARIAGVDVGGWEVLRNVLYRARARTVQLDGGRPRRLVPATAPDGLILRLGEGRDYPRPFALAPNADSIAIRIAGAEGRPLRIAFFAQRVEKPVLKGSKRPADSGL
jgi:hypothetical protein